MPQHTQFSYQLSINNNKSKECQMHIGIGKKGVYQ